MILVGNQRGGGRNLAMHLLKEENDHVEVHQLRGFASDDLVSAFQEIHAISRATKCRQYLYSLSLNPPQGETVGVPEFEAAIERIEKRLGLEEQPRAIVFHSKEARRHCHAVWSRIDIETMTAVKLPYTKNKLNEIARDLFHEHGWTLPEGFRQDRSSNPLNYTLAEYQQAKRAGRDPKALKRSFQECWARSDTPEAFSDALEERGLHLARGDRRGFVALDYQGEVYSLSRWAGVKTKELKARLGDPAQYPSVDEVQADIARKMTPVLVSYMKEVLGQAQADLASYQILKDDMVKQQRDQRVQLKDVQEVRRGREAAERAGRFTKGLKGLWHWITGKNRKIKKRNELEAKLSQERDEKEKQALEQRQQDERERLQRHLEEAYTSYHEKIDNLNFDLAHLSEHDVQGIKLQKALEKERKQQINLREEFRHEIER